MQPILLCNARLADGQTADLLVIDGIVAAVGPCGSLTQPPGAPPLRIDLTGQLLLPSLVDGHTHLDKTLWGMPWRPHAAGDERESRIELEKQERASLPPPEIRAESLLRAMIAQGTTATRTHADIDPEAGLRNLHALLAVKQRFADLIDIQIVAFPQSGIARAPGIADLLDQAMAEGADLVGGIDPLAYDGDLDGHLDTVFGLAGKHGKGLDIHLHTTGPTGQQELDAILARATGMAAPGLVTISHGFRLGELDPAALASTAETMAAAGVSVATSAAGGAPMAPVKTLTAAGVAVFAGSDNVRDRWGPYGTGCMLERAMLVGWKQNFRRDADLELAFAMCAGVGRAQLRLPEAGTEVGMVADLMALPSECIAEAVISRPPRSLVMKAGRVLYQAPPQQPPSLALEPKP